MTPKKILLIDDSETALQLEQMILQESSFEFVTARNGEEGVRTALETKPDLILMDAVMPRLNGFDAIRRLRRNELTKAVPIVIVTNKSELASMEAGFESGCSDYVLKPIDGLELVAKVKNLLGG
jgi:DNA-binding response OmpR family regulator